MNSARTRAGSSSSTRRRRRRRRLLPRRCCLTVLASVRLLLLPLVPLCRPTPSSSTSPSLHSLACLLQLPPPLIVAHHRPLSCCYLHFPPSALRRSSGLPVTTSASLLSPRDQRRTAMLHPVMLRSMPAG